MLLAALESLARGKGVLQLAASGKVEGQGLATYSLRNDDGIVAPSQCLAEGHCRCLITRPDHRRTLRLQRDVCRCTRSEFAVYRHAVERNVIDVVRHGRMLCNVQLQLRKQVVERERHGAFRLACLPRRIQEVGLHVGSASSALVGSHREVEGGRESGGARHKG